MFNSIFSNWSIKRGLYLIGGILIITESAKSTQWVGIVLGAYFALMGLCGIGCAGGSCYQPNTNAKQSEKTEINDDIIFDEVK